MEPQIIELRSLQANTAPSAAVTALEAGKVLHFPVLGFLPRPDEQRLFTSDIRHPRSRNISLDAGDRLKGAAGDPEIQAALTAMMLRFRAQAERMLAELCPAYTSALRRGPVSFRPMQVETRVQSWRADDRRLHVDAFPSRPNRGERLLRVFANVNPEGRARVWRVGQPFEEIARRFLPRLQPYSRWRAKALNALGVTKSLRSEYDHLMLQLHDAMKSDPDFQYHAPQVTAPFGAGSSWICFSDQTAHAAMSGQYLLELTMQLPPGRQVDPGASPLAILSRLTGRALISVP
jgi:hypothetical protein